jgi:hypothetical protein
MTNVEFSEYGHVPTENLSGWFISGNYLFQVGTEYPLVIVEFIPENPEEAAQYEACNGDLSSAPCLASDGGEFPIDPDLIAPMYQMTLEFLGFSMQLPEDNLGNARSVSTGQDLE